MFQKQINNLDPSPDLEPSYTMASPLKYAKIQKKKKAFKNDVHEFVISFANWERLRWGTHYFQKNQKNLVFISVLDFLFT